MAVKIVAEELTADILRAELSYDGDSGEFRRLKTRGRWKAGERVGTHAKSTGYIVMWVRGALYFAHRLAWLYTYGTWPAGLIDHINMCRTDNRIVNLRSVSHSGNLRNHRIRTDNTSGTSGVNWTGKRGRWRARAFVNGKDICLGVFRRKTDAVRARRMWEIANPIEPIEEYGN